MISIHTTHRSACVLVGLVGALVALSAATPAALAHRPPPPAGSGGSAQAQTPIHTIVTNGGRGAPRPVPCRRVSPVRHVVVIYLENHSFDNVLGFWCDANPGRCPQGGMPASVTLSDGAVVSPSVMRDKIPNVNHDVASQRAAMNIQGGVPRMNGWQNIPPPGLCDAPRYQCISGAKPSAEPNITSLGGRFAISDNFFSLADSPSWGGHLYVVAGALDRFTGDNPRAASRVTARPGWGCDSDKVTPWISPTGKHELEPACVPDPALSQPNGGAFRHTPVAPIPTILDRLGTAGLTWRIYGVPVRDGERAPVNDYSDGYVWSICPTIAKCLYTSQSKNLVPSANFQHDALNGNLPAFSVVTPGGKTFKKSCHNLFSLTACDNWLGSLVSAIMDGPDWSSTAVFITWDDFGGFYDQVPPPSTLDANGQQAGPRVPLIIVSPYAKPGYTDTSPTTFAGILGYTEHTFGLAPLGVNDAQAYDFSNAFNYSQLPLKRVPMVHRPLPAAARRIRVTPALANDPT